MNIGVIGSNGRMGKKRADILRKMYDDVKLSLFDIKDTCWYSNYKDFIMSTDFDGVFVCVPHTRTTEIVRFCLDKNIPVFAEKPPGICIKDVISMKPKSMLTTAITISCQA